MGRAAVSEAENGETLLAELAGFADILTEPIGVDDVLYELVSCACRVLSREGAGVGLLDEGRLHAVTWSGDRVGSLERLQAHRQTGPGLEAVSRREAVVVSDVADSTSASTWPVFRAAALEAGVHAVAGIPLVAAGEALGVLDVYGDDAHTWSDAELETIRVLTALVSGYLVRSSELERHRRATQQLQQALDSRVIIEQAKGVLAASRGIPVGEAFLLMREYARSHNLRLEAVATAVVHVGFRP